MEVRAEEDRGVVDKDAADKAPAGVEDSRAVDGKGKAIGSPAHSERLRTAFALPIKRLPYLPHTAPRVGIIGC